MGIDVGGTHTKAVAIDNATHEIIGKSSVKTTHDDKAGVATGVVQAFKNCLKENDIDPKDVIFVAHSTTQATNAPDRGRRCTGRCHRHRRQRPRRLDRQGADESEGH